MSLADAFTLAVAVFDWLARNPWGAAFLLLLVMAFCTSVAIRWLTKRTALGERRLDLAMSERKESVEEALSRVRAEAANIAKQREEIVALYKAQIENMRHQHEADRAADREQWQELITSLRESNEALSSEVQRLHAQVNTLTYRIDELSRSEMRLASKLRAAEDEVVALRRTIKILNDDLSRCRVVAGQAGAVAAGET